MSGRHEAVFRVKVSLDAFFIIDTSVDLVVPREVMRWWKDGDDMQLPEYMYFRDLCILLTHEKVDSKQLVYPRIRPMSQRRTLHAEIQGAETSR
jgi:hypothetical protein